MQKRLSLLIIAALMTGVTVTFAINTFAAKEATTGAATKLQEKVATAKEEAKAKILGGVRNFANARTSASEKAIVKAEALASKLQLRIDQANKAGKYTTGEEKLMTDIRNKIADAKTRVASLKEDTLAAETKADFTAVQTQLKAVRDDLRIVSQDSAKIIKSLKSFNSASSESSHSATVKSIVKPTASPSVKPTAKPTAKAATSSATTR
jgi:septation ring formation regulator EzrA